MFEQHVPLALRQLFERLAKHNYVVVTRMQIGWVAEYTARTLQSLLRGAVG